MSTGNSVKLKSNKPEGRMVGFLTLYFAQVLCATTKEECTTVDNKRNIILIYLNKQDIKIIKLKNTLASILYTL